MKYLYGHAGRQAARTLRLSKDPAVRFMASVQKGEVEGQCWKWIGGIHRTGYGHFWMNGKTVSEPRIYSTRGRSRTGNWYAINATTHRA